MRHSQASLAIPSVDPVPTPDRPAVLPQAPAGIRIESADAASSLQQRQAFHAQLDALGLADHVEIGDGDACIADYRLRTELAAHWAPGGDTLGLCAKLGLDTAASRTDLEREILLAMLLAPRPLIFPSHAELAAAVRIRCNIVEAARRTTLDFHTTEAERPADCWHYAEGRGFVLLPGKSLIEALTKATQPDESGTLYSFSCYRATEYVILLGIAQELERSNPALLQRLESLWRSRAIMSGEFHEVFLEEYGSMEEPLPPKYFVPGDRTWFRNPDDHSSDVTGYEGSWVMYLGNGLFTNFWKRNQPYTMTGKCLEIFHWRHATWRDAAGELQLDERVVERRIAESQQDPAEVERILERMLRLRDPGGVYAEGGCIDTSREFPRRVCPGTCGLRLPEI